MRMLFIDFAGLIKLTDEELSVFKNHRKWVHAVNESKDRTASVISRHNAAKRVIGYELNGYDRVPNFFSDALLQDCEKFSDNDITKVFKDTRKCEQRDEEILRRSSPAPAPFTAFFASHAEPPAGMMYPLHSDPSASARASAEFRNGTMGLSAYIKVIADGYEVAKVKLS